MTISIIIPVYNTSKFLRDCLDSIVNQTYKDLEIVCVNDGSSDNSLEILEEYKNKDSRFKVFSQENKGQSAARNFAIKNATGEYIAFVDSDDIIDLDYFEKLHNAILENNCDIAATTILRTRKHNKKVRVKYDKVEVFETLADKIKVCDIPKCCYACGKLFKTELIKDEPLRENAYFEDVLWMPNILKKSNKLVTVPDTNYYYIVNTASTVKKRPSKKKQRDAYIAKKFIVDFFKNNNIELSNKNKNVTKRIYYIGNLPIMKIKECENVETFNLFGILPIFKKKIKTPIIKDNTFIVCELCSSSHAEVVPGFVKYLLELGYHVSVLVNPDRYKEGLFERFKDENVSLNKMTRKETKEYFRNNTLEDVKGVIITTVGKICDNVHYDKAYEAFHPDVDKRKLFFVEHDVNFAADKGTWKEDLITLRKMNYKNISSVVVNPHYFGDIKKTSKNEVTNFITIGAINPNRKNCQMIVDSASELVKKGYTNFKITVIGKGNLKHIPKEVRKYFDIKGRLPFKKMYEEIEKSDFFLTSYNENNPLHLNYNTTSTSGNFQLIYGFLKPCIIIKSFAPINGFDENNSILYDRDEDYANALVKGIEMSSDDYSKMQESLDSLVKEIASSSKENLKTAIERRI